MNKNTNQANILIIETLNSSQTKQLFSLFQQLQGTKTMEMKTQSEPMIVKQHKHPSTDWITLLKEARK
jgi:hypothetical protein